jgi:hypothetical protein
MNALIVVLIAMFVILIFITPLVLMDCPEKLLLIGEKLRFWKLVRLKLHKVCTPNYRLTIEKVNKKTGRRWCHTYPFFLSGSTFEVELLDGGKVGTSWYHIVGWEYNRITEGD